MRSYGMTYLISAETPGEELRLLQEKISSLIQKQEGIVNEAKTPIKRGLAYKIKKQREAFISGLDFYLKPEALAELESELRSEKRIIRYLIWAKPKVGVARIKKEPIKTGSRTLTKEKKVELKEIDKKLEEILGE